MLKSENIMDICESEGVNRNLRGSVEGVLLDFVGGWIWGALPASLLSLWARRHKNPRSRCLFFNQNSRIKESALPSSYLSLMGIGTAAFLFFPLLSLLQECSTKLSLKKKKKKIVALN